MCYTMDGTISIFAMKPDINISAGKLEKKEPNVNELKRVDVGYSTFLVSFVYIIYANTHTHTHIDADIPAKSHMLGTGDTF